MFSNNLSLLSPSRGMEEFRDSSAFTEVSITNNNFLIKCQQSSIAVLTSNNFRKILQVTTFEFCGLRHH